MKRVFAVLAVFAVACHHDAPAPAEPAGTPPLPPASGTPVGFLVDAAADLHLRDDQVAALRDIDTSLGADLESIDAQTRAANRPTDADAAPAQPMGRRGGRHGGMGGGGAMPSGGHSGGHHKRGGGSGSAVSPSGGAAASRLADQRAGEVREALKRAFAVLDAGQQQQAKQVLAAHDVDVDADAAPAPPPTSGSDDDPAPEP